MRRDCEKTYTGFVMMMMMMMLVYCIIYTQCILYILYIDDVDDNHKKTYTGLIIVMRSVTIVSKVHCRDNMKKLS